MGKRPLKLRVVVADDGCDGYADGSSIHVRVNGQSNPVATRPHVERRTFRAAIREHQSPERFHAPIVDERGYRGGLARQFRPYSTAAAAVFHYEHGTVERTYLSESSGVHRSEPLPVFTGLAEKTKTDRILWPPHKRTLFQIFQTNLINLNTYNVYTVT